MGIEEIAQGLIVVASLAWIGDIVRGIFQRRKVTSEANLHDANSVQVLVGSAITVVAPLKARVEELSAELVVAKDRVDKLIIQLEKSTAENRRITDENQRITAENQAITNENRQLRLALGRGLL